MNRPKISIDRSCALLIIDAQKGFLCPSWGKRNNAGAENKLRTLLATFRGAKLPIVHVHHLSREEQSPLRPAQEGVEPMEGCEPRLGERVFQKTVNSAFIGTELESHFRRERIETLYIAGFTTDHCVSTSARMAANLGFLVSINTDATVAFERIGRDTVYDPTLVHEVSLASLSGEFAELILTNDLVRLTGSILVKT